MQVNHVQIITQDIELSFDNTDERIWARYGGAGDYKTPTWRQKDLYLGSCFNELENGRYQPIPIKFAGAALEELRYELQDHSPGVMAPSYSSVYEKQDKFSPGLCNVMFMRDQTYPRINDKFIPVTACQSSPCHARWNSERGNDRCVDANYPTLTQLPLFLGRSKRIPRSRYRIENSSQTSHSKIGLIAPKVSRFGFGISEQCNSGLHICPSRGDPEFITATRKAREAVNINQLIESGVTVWENYRLVIKQFSLLVRPIFSRAQYNYII